MEKLSSDVVGLHSSAGKKQHAKAMGAQSLGINHSVKTGYKCAVSKIKDDINYSFRPVLSHWCFLFCLSAQVFLLRTCKL